MGAPQIIIILMMAAGWGIALAKHGERRDDYNVWMMTIAVAIEAAVLWWGGFWS